MAQLSQLDGSNGFRVDGVDMFDASGASVAGAGDVNGDGIGDLIIGAPRSYTSDPGKSYVVFGSSADFGASLDLAALDGTNGFRLDATDQYAGASVAGAGDVNGDGIDDLIIGARGDGHYVGKGYVVFGSATGFAANLNLSALDGTNGFRLDGVDRYDQSGRSVAGAGDVNGDGIADLIIGAPGDGISSETPGASYVVFGSAAGFAASLALGALDGTNGFRLDGVEGDYYTGRSVAGAGDVNGDGVDDLIVGAPGNGIDFFDEPSNSYIVFGSSSGFVPSVDLATLNGANGFRLNGVEASDYSGASVAGAGDVNGDGVDDVIVSTPGGFFPDEGRASYVVFGSATGFTASIELASLDGTNGFRLDGSGGPVAGAGDINGDGLDDVIVNARGDYFSPGANYVVFGSSSGFAASLDLALLNGTNGFRLDGSRGQGAVAGAGDVNGDGIDDLIVGDHNAERGAGASYVIYGSTQLGGANDAPSAPDDVLSVASSDVVDLVADHGAGADQDPDLDDLTITAINGMPVAADDSVTLASGLRVTLLGSGEIRFDAPGLALGTSFSESFTYEISDGRGASDSASVSVDYVQDKLALSTLDGTNGFRVAGIEGGSGYSVAGAVDINGDGFDDVIIGAPRVGDPDPGYYHVHGASYVVFGSSAGFPSSIEVTALDGTNGFTLIGPDSSDSGSYVAGVGDVNGDGVDDLIIAAPYSVTIFVAFGSTQGGFAPNFDLGALDGTDGFRLVGLPGAPAPFSYDYSVAGAGDINGDGIDDLIVGAPHIGVLYGNEGSSFVVFGSSDGFAASLDLTTLDGTDGFRIDGIDWNDYSGYSVAGAGDVNGDGIDDLIVGVRNTDAGIYGDYDTSVSHVVFGSAAGFGASFDLTALDGNNGFSISKGGGAGFGGGAASVAGAGDVNGDGIDDVIVGVPNASPNGKQSAGESYLVFGSATGFGANVDLAALDGSNGFSIEGTDAYDLSGTSVASAGDFNGDGIDDLIIGASGADPGGQGYAGESYVVFGSAAGFGANIDLADLDASEGFVIAGIDADDRSGGSVAGAGDVNGDGFDDLIIGAPGADPGGRENAGESYVIFGFSTVEAGTRTALVATSADDAEQGVGGRMQLASHDLDIGQRAGKPVGLRFTGLEVPDGATITSAYIEFEARRSGRCPAEIAIAVEDATDSAAFGFAADISTRDHRDETTARAPAPWVKGESYRTADLAATVAALVGTDGLDADGALAFRFTDLGERTAWSFDGKGATAKLVIEFEGGAPDPPVPLADPVSQMPVSADLVGALANPIDLDADGFRFIDMWDEYLLP